MNRAAIMHNLRVKSFPDGSSEVLLANRAVFREAGWEQLGKRTNVLEPPQEDPAELSQYALERLERSEVAKARANLDRAKRRARTMLRDYALCTPMRYFLTFTFDPKKVDRYSVPDTVRKFGQWMANHVRRNGISYVAVAEYHKDGAVHFHALVTEGLSMADSGTMIPPGGGRPRKPSSKAQRAAWVASGGRVVYNVSGWPYGFSTAMELYGDYHAAVGYVCKYITKAPAKIGGRWFYSGGKLGTPDVLWADVDFEAVCRQYQVTEVECRDLPGVRMVKFTIPPAASAASEDTKRAGRRPAQGGAKPRPTDARTPAASGQRPAPSQHPAGGHPGGAKPRQGPGAPPERGTEAGGGHRRQAPP